MVEGPLTPWDDVVSAPADIGLFGFHPWIFGQEMELFAAWRLYWFPPGDLFGGDGRG